MHEYMLENKLKPVVNKDSVLPEIKERFRSITQKNHFRKKNTSRKTQYSFPRKRIT